MFKDIIRLVAYPVTINEFGDPVSDENPIETEVFANKKSVRQSEFYQAAATGLKAELMFEMRQADYADEREIQYEGKVYKIIRTFQKDSELIELICQSLVD
jgi:SPP1 family predicted phage head-tail adaptor